MALGRAYTFAMAAVIAKLCKTAGASDSALMLTLCALQMLVLLLLLNKHRVTHPYTAYLQRHLQSVLNAAARRVFRLRRYDPITDALATLHWLRLPERVDFKVAVMAFRVLQWSGTVIPGSVGSCRRPSWSPPFALIHIPTAARSGMPSYYRRPPLVSGCCIRHMELVVSSCPVLGYFVCFLPTSKVPCFVNPFRICYYNCIL